MEQANKLWAAVTVLAVVVIAGGAYAYFSHNRAAVVSVPLQSVSYSCAQGTITAAYASSSVALALSDGRSLTLPQVRSGSGTRYEDTVGGKDVTFSSKGSDAFLEEGGSVTYSNCIAGTQTPAPSTPAATTFTDVSKTFSFNYVEPLAVTGGGGGYSTDWMQNATTSGLVLAVVTLPRSFEPSTNFSEAKLTVGTSADADALSECLTYNSSGGPVTAPSQQTINGVTYSVFKSSDAGAGNFYDTVSYRTVRNNQCYALEYTVHTTNLGNYSPDQGIKAYDKQKVADLLTGVVQSFTFLQ
jgi:membrane-bound inhibitor of C-type lysozyme